MIPTVSSTTFSLQPLEDKRTPFCRAIISGDIEVVKQLITSGANVHAKNNHGKIPLWLAIERGKTQIAELLIRSGADINAKNKHKQTPLHYSEKNW